MNRKPLEKVLGVDLVYWDEVNGIFTLVQYKRLTRQLWEKPSMKATWAFTRRSELIKLLERVTLTRASTVTTGDWRLTASPFWFKFVRAEDFVSGDPWVLRGMCVPADYLRVALAAEELRDGPRRGFAVTHQNMKYITRGTFVELVRRGLVGTTNAGTRGMLAVIADLAATDEVVLALKTSADRPVARGPTNSLDDPF